MTVTEVVMPSMGADMTEGAIARWLKAEGDEVSRGDVLAEVETDKAVVEMESYGSGTLRQILISEGITVPVGQIIAFIADPSDELPTVNSNDRATTSSAPPESATTTAAAPEELESPAETAPVVAAGRIKASPVAKKLASEHGIDLATVPGTGPGGRIIKSDVESAIVGAPELAPEPATEAASAAPPTSAVAPVATAAPVVPVTPRVSGAPVGEDIPLTGMRRAIARTVVRSKADQPDFWISTQVDMTEALALRAQLNVSLESESVKISVNDMILKASAMAIQKYPKWNTTYTDEKLIANADINLGVAIALESGLMVPAILGCQSKSLKEISIAARDLGLRTRANQLTDREVTGGTFSVSNLGMFGVDEFNAIIMPRQAGILAVGVASPMPVVRDGEIAVSIVMKMTLTVDHRVNDGAEAAVFSNEIKALLENPLGLVL